ncbi:hypothetical protein K3495_g13088 [Podosphaera aphanis]|nr:hypothetical protein K3495_g13088 [Podosphaera aphanis]
MQSIASDVADEFYQSPVRPIGSPIPPRHPVGKHQQYQNKYHKQPLSKPNKALHQLPIHEVVNISKTYRDEDRYGGAENSFELCLGIFYDTCRRTGVQTQLNKGAFSSMLKGSAREYYHLYLMNSSLTFDEMATRLMAHFKTAERQEQTLSTVKPRYKDSGSTLVYEFLLVENLSLQRLTEEKPTISCAECFEILVKELRRTQSSLPNRYQGDESLRDAVVGAVRDVQECSFACYKPAATFEALCADIWASIVTEEQLSKTKLTHQNRPQRLMISDQMYTDRYYKGMRSKSSPKNLDTRKYPKRCFVCKRKKFWSSNHTKEERECEGKQEDSNFEVWDEFIINSHLDNELDDNIIDDQFITGYGVIFGLKTITFLNTNQLNMLSHNWTHFTISPEVISSSDSLSFDSIPSSIAITSFPKLASIHDTPPFLSNDWNFDGSPEKE